MHGKSATNTDRAIDTDTQQLLKVKVKKRLIDSVDSITKWVHLLTYLRACLRFTGINFQQILRFRVDAGIPCKNLSKAPAPLLNVLQFMITHDL